VLSSSLTTQGEKDLLDLVGKLYVYHDLYHSSSWQVPKDELFERARSFQDSLESLYIDHSVTVATLRGVEQPALDLLRGRVGGRGRQRTSCAEGAYYKHRRSLEFAAAGAPTTGAPFERAEPERTEQTPPLPATVKQGRSAREGSTKK